jgi:O-antigen ligase
MVNFRRVILVLLSAGMFVATAGYNVYWDGSKFHNGFYLLFLLPGLVYVATDLDLFREILRKPLSIFAVIFLFTVTLSLLYPDTEVHPEKELAKIALILVSLFIIGQFVSGNAALFKKILMLGVMAVALVAVYHMYQFYWVEKHSYHVRMSGYFLPDNPLFVAGTFGFFFVTATYLAIECRRQSLIVFLMALSGCALMVAITATQCRSFFVAVLAALVIPYFSKGRNTIIVILISFLVVILLAVYINPALLERTELTRLQVWQYSLELIGEKPFFGWGSSYDMDLKIGRTTLIDPHNILLTVWLKHGVLAFVALILLLGYASFVILNNRDNATLRLGGALLMFGVTMLFFEGHDIIAKPNRMWVMVWVPLGIMMGAIQEKYHVSGGEQERRV